MNGLAQQAMGQQEQQISQDMVKQVAELLMQGMTPEELIQRGVPQEVVEMAMALVSQQATQIPEESAGLAGMAMPSGM